jgi:nifR3 family TIM-barrel protein
MISSEAILRNSTKTLGLLKRGDNETRLGVQLMAATPRVAAQSVAAIAQYAPTLVDLNCGCSVPKVVKTGAGAALLRKPLLIKAIIRALKDSCDVPITVKLRAGWDESSINFLETAERAIEGGAQLVCLHPRTVAQRFSATARWSFIRRLKHQVDVPVIGSGDLFEAEDAVNMIAGTGCDGAMIARGAMGNPFIFAQISDLLRGMRPREISVRTRLETAIKQLKIAVEAKGEGQARLEIKKHLCAYTKGLAGGASLRASLMGAATPSLCETIIRSYLAETERGAPDR